jgi:hypothetical protein
LSSGDQAGDEAGEHGGRFLAHQFGIVVLVEFVEFDQRTCEPRFAPDLAGAQGPKQMDDLGGIDTHRGQPTIAGHRCQYAVLGVRAVQVVSHPAPERIELDAGANHIAVGGDGIERHRQMLGLEYLKLQPNCQPIFRSPVAQAHDRFTTFQHGATG